ncbi:hypothetical protein JKP88DRAFT_129807, partial [Tribonema minus]
VVEFLDAAAALRWLELPRAQPGGADESERLALFLNLYHLMVLHAYLLVGPPGGAIKWSSYLSGLSYEIGGDVLSLAELEHCVIRAAAAPAKQYPSKLLVPSEKYAFALSAVEPRVNFALCCGGS